MLVYDIRSLNDVNFTIEVELNDQPFTTRWREYFARTLIRCPNLVWYSTTINNPLKSLTEEECRPFLENIKIALDFFNNNTEHEVKSELNLVNLILADVGNLKQEHLNIWHRCFTRLATIYFSNEAIIPQNFSKNTVINYVHDVNGYTHQLERFTYADLPRRTTLFDTPQKQFTAQCMDAHNLNSLTNGVWADNFIEHIEPGGFDFNQHDYNFTVWLHEDIQGKDQMKAWLDYDDLTQNDVQGNHIMTPNVTFDPNMTYAKILNNVDFRTESLTSNKTIDRYPLGNIRNLNTINWEEMPGSTITKITLDNYLLYQYHE